MFARRSFSVSDGMSSAEESNDASAEPACLLREPDEDELVLMRLCEDVGRERDAEGLGAPDWPCRTIVAMSVREDSETTH